MKLHLGILPPPQRLIWDALGALPVEFVLNGGTAIALQLGHRQSIDFDLFALTLLAGTVFAATKLPLTTLLLAIHLLTSTKTNMAALELMRHLGGERNGGKRGRGAAHKQPFVIAV